MKRRKKMECKPEDWKKGKKVFLAIISLIVAAMAILAVVLVVNNKKAPAAVRSEQDAARQPFEKA